MAENMVYQTEKLLSEQGEKVAEDKKGKVESAVEALKEALTSDNTDDIKAKMEALSTEMQAVSADLYSQQAEQADGEQEADASQESGDESGRPKEDADTKEEGDVIDADFEMVDDGKK